MMPVPSPTVADLAVIDEVSALLVREGDGAARRLGESVLCLRSILDERVAALDLVVLGVVASYAESRWSLHEWWDRRGYPRRRLSEFCGALQRWFFFGWPDVTSRPEAGSSDPPLASAVVGSIS